MSELSQLVEDLKVGIGALIGGGLAGLVMWAKAKRTHAEVSKDELRVQENRSESRTIDRLERQLAIAEAGRMKAEDKAAVMQDLLMAMKVRAETAEANNKRMAVRLDYLIDLQVDAHPEVAIFRPTRPAELGE